MRRYNTHIPLQFIIGMIILFHVQHMNGQPVIEPLMENPYVSQNIKYADGIPTVHLSSKGGEEITFCITKDILNTHIIEVINSQCNALSSVNILELDSCIRLQIDNVSEDTYENICLEIRGTNNIISYLNINIAILPPIPIPFIDDFHIDSTVIPSKKRWIDSYVFQNNSLALHPPSIGVVTFDGLNELGMPYGNAHGVSDYLTSRFIDMKSTADPHLYFWLQPRGLGFDYYPQVRDSFIVEFKLMDGTWEKVLTIPGIGEAGTINFISYEIPIENKFRYNGFQFRMYNLSPRNGMLSMWHLDNVLIFNQRIDPNNLRDIAFTYPPQYLLKHYTSMPYVHFKANENKYLIDSVSIDIRNNNNKELTVESSSLEVREKVTSSSLIPFETLLETPPIVSENQRNLKPGTHHFVNAIKNRPQMTTVAQNLAIEDEDFLEFELSQYFTSTTDIEELKGNNAIHRITHMKDYFAMDDGVAEAGIYINAGSSFSYLVQEFEFEVADTLKGLQLFFPHVVPNADKQRHRLVIFQESLDSKPIYERIYNEPLYVDELQDNNKAFTTYDFKNSNDEDTTFYIPKGKLFVGWQQISSSNIGLYVGFDRSINNSDKIWYKTGTKWFNLAQEDDKIKGTIMIRPVVGKSDVISTKTEDLVGNHKNIVLYPNPVHDLLSIKWQKKVQKYHIYNSFGQLMRSDIVTSIIDVSELRSGLYFVVGYSYKNRPIVNAKFIKQ